jgi:ATP-dependent DNA helicase RecQ
VKNPIDILIKYWGYPEFRAMQEDIILSILDGKDTLALLPTGGGKSICFQVPALCIEGLCLVISPLIALMKDQVEQLKKRHIPAAAIYSGMTKREVDIVLDNCRYGQVKFLYLSPERLKTDIFKERVKSMNVSIVAIDEAHCISQWGYDFRRPYMDIPELYPLIGEVKKVALTATATKEVKVDISEKLEFKEPVIFQKSFARKNLSYSVFHLENKEQKLLEILNNVKGSAIVYVKSRKATQKVSDMLTRENISADYYHAGLSTKIRTDKQDNWINNRSRVMVSTNAFGMGIDKPDVRVVVHLDLPESLEAYYQEAGRAGRDEKNAFAVLLYNKSDISRLKENFERSFPSIEYLKRIYQALANYYKLAVGSSQLQSFDFDMENFSKNFRLKPYDVFYAIKKLEEQGLILLNESFYKPSTLMLSVSNEGLYKYCIANQKYEPILKGLLRLYGGEVYQEFLKISEYDLAKLIKSNSNVVIKQLEYLHSNNILVYDKIKENPQLTFLTPRQDSGSLKLDKVQLKTRRKNVEIKLKAIIAYADNENSCKTRIFQEYFDEAAYLNCGVCDRCIAEKKKAQRSDELQVIMEEVLSKSSLDPIYILDLKKMVQTNNDFLFTEAIRILSDKGDIELNEKNEVKKFD